MWLPASIESLNWDYTHSSSEYPHGKGVLNLWKFSLGNQYGIRNPLKEAGAGVMSLTRQKLQVSLPLEENAVWLEKHGSPSMWSAEKTNHLHTLASQKEEAPLPVSCDCWHSDTYCVLLPL